MEKMIIAIDDSEGSMKAVDYVARHCAGYSDLKITLLHILPALAARSWEEGHILTEKEKAERKRDINNWINSQKAKMETTFKSAMDTLSKGGLTPEQMETRSICDFVDVAESILTEAGDGGYQTIILGRRGHSGVTKFLMGSVATKVINHGTGLTICVVE